MNRSGAGWLLPGLATLFFLSGMSGLIYQVLWLRLLALVFGVTVWAASTVLAGFMAGLGIGSLIAGRLIDRVRLPLLWYGAAEVLVGLSALATPAALDAVERAYVGLSSSLPNAPAALALVRFLLAFAVLIVPTSLMGATLPIVVKSSLLRAEGLGRRAGLLYATNTAGAMAGALLAGFVLVGGIGIGSSFRLAAALNLLVGVAAIGASCVLANRPAVTFAGAGSTAPPAAPPEPPKRAVSEQARRLVLAVFAVSGFTALALEVIWFRVLVLYLVATTYAFTIMLAAVLAGIAAGSFVVAPLLRRRQNWLALLAGIELAIALTAVLSLMALARAADFFAGAGTLLAVLPGQVALAAIASVAALFPATLLMGVAFPIGLYLWTGEGADSSKQTGEHIGLFYALNVFGGILGPVGAGFVLLPSLGSRASLGVIAGLSLISGLVLVFASRRQRGHGPRRPVGATHASPASGQPEPWVPEGNAFFPPFGRGMPRPYDMVTAACSRISDTGRVALGGVGLLLFLLAVTTMPDPFAHAVARRYPSEQLLWQEEGVQTTVTVHQRRDDARSLYLDGLYQASDAPSQLLIHRMNAHLPMVLHPNPREALVVGLGGGVTAGAVSRHTAEVDVVELSGSVVRGSDWFRHVNEDLLRRPNVHLRVDDGRNYLLLTTKRYDLITSDLVGPTQVGAGNLYSAEYFRLAREALADDGIMAQWVGSFLPETQHRLIVRTFLNVFPESTLWFDGTVLIGSKRPLRLDPADVERRLQDASTREALASIGVRDVESLFSLYWAGPEELRRYAGTGPILTDDRPMVEYFLSLPQGEGPPDLRSLQGDPGRRPAT